MLRRHVTPALLAFSAMLLCISARPLLAPRLLPFIAFVLTGGAFGIVLLRTPLWGRAGLLLVAVTAGCILGTWSIERIVFSGEAASLPIPPAQVSWFSGALRQDSSTTQEGDTVLRVALQTAGSEKRAVAGRARGAVLLLLRGSYAFSLGETIRVHARLNPFEGRTGENFAASVQRGDLLRTGTTSPLWAARAAARDWLHRAVSRAGYPASSLMEALLIGSREDVTADLYDSFKRTGSLHILALSGLHVSVIYGFLILVLGFLPSRGLRLGIATFVLLCYQVLAGFMPSLLRATIMICLAGICISLDRDREPLNLLSLSGITILLLNPHEAYSLSFQLSFLALAGILLLGPLVQRALEGTLPRVLLAPLAMSLGAQMATFPLVVAKFGVWFPSGLLAGLVLVPLTTAMLWAGLGWILLASVPWPWLHDAGARALAILYGAIDQSARIMGRLPGISFSRPFSTAAVVLSIAAILCLAILVPRRYPAPLRPARASSAAARGSS